jgi:hypothetical protein
MRGVAIVGCSLVVVMQLGAQETASNRWRVDSGSLVRLHTSGPIITGRLLAPLMASDSVIRFCRYPGPPCDVRDSAAMRSAAVSQVMHLDLQKGNGAARGARTWGIVGGVLGAFMGVAFAEIGDQRRSSETQAVKGFFLVGGFFALLGAVFGSASIRWGAGPW